MPTTNKRINLTDPEPLPPEHPLWGLENAHITMHLSGIPTPASQSRAARRFVQTQTQLEEALSLLHGKAVGTLRLGLMHHRSAELLPQIPVLIWKQKASRRCPMSGQAWPFWWRPEMCGW